MIALNKGEHSVAFLSVHKTESNFSERIIALSFREDGNSVSFVAYSQLHEIDLETLPGS